MFSWNRKQIAVWVKISEFIAPRQHSQWIEEQHCQLLSYFFSKTSVPFDFCSLKNKLSRQVLGFDNFMENGESLITTSSFYLVKKWPFFLLFKKYLLMYKLVRNQLVGVNSLLIPPHRSWELVLGPQAWLGNTFACWEILMAPRLFFPLFIYFFRCILFNFHSLINSYTVKCNFI